MNYDKLASDNVGATLEYDFSYQNGPWTASSGSTCVKVPTVLRWPGLVGRR